MSASISIQICNESHNVFIAKILESKISDVTRNACLLIAFLTTICDSDEKLKALITYENKAVLKFLSAAVMKIKTVTNSQVEEFNNASNNLDLNEPEQSQFQSCFDNSEKQMETAIFALIAFMQCFDELPKNVSFKDYLSRDLKEYICKIDPKNACDLIMGRLKSWPTNKKEYVTLMLQVLINRTWSKFPYYKVTTESTLVSCTNGMNPLSWGRWVFGNYSLGHQTYQFKMTKSVSKIVTHLF